MFDKFNDECGVFGIYGTPDAAAHTALGLHALQHRGQEAAGIVSCDHGQFLAHRALGLVGDNFSDAATMNRLHGSAAIGHNRYSTTGETHLRNVQPFYADIALGGFALAHNGNLTNAMTVRRELIGLGRDISARAQTIEVENDPKDQIVAAEQALYKLGEQGHAEKGFVSFLKAVTEAVHSAAAAYQREGGLAGISTGLVDLDKKLGGLHPSDLLILAGRPSMGKTSLATNIAFNIAKAHKRGRLPDGGEGSVEGGVVGFFSLPQSKLIGYVLPAVPPMA